MVVNVVLGTEDDKYIKIISSEKHGFCRIEIEENNKIIGREVHIEELKLALKKLTAR